MKVLLVSDARSIHTKRWVEGLSKRGVEIVLYSLYPPADDFFDRMGIKCQVYNLFTYGRKGFFNKLKGFAGHFKAASHLKSVIRQEKPDILHAHYATSFGLVAALTGFHPFILSVWGSDVYSFPYLSVLNRKTVDFSMRMADKLLSTSHVMVEQCKNFTDKDIAVTPFGVDLEMFRKSDIKIFPDTDKCFTVGNVKTLSQIYGIDVLIRAFKIFSDRNSDKDTRLVIVGDGPNRKEYESLAAELAIAHKVTFAGKVPNNELPAWYNSFSVSVSLSDSESFGVVAVEAMACGCPVVTSDADGFTEVVEDGVTGFIVPKRNPEAAADAMQKVLDNPELGKELGANGRKRVEKLYDWNDNVDLMVKIYKEFKH